MPRSASRRVSTSTTIVDALATGWSAPHRVELVRLRGATIIDDSYNASPGSVAAALDLLADLPGRHVAVLGEMLELGDAHDSGHHAVGEAAADVAELLIVVGPAADGIAAGAHGGRARSGTRSTSCRMPRPRWTRSSRGSETGDVVLVKASRGIGLDRVVDGLRLHLGEAAR